MTKSRYSVAFKSVAAFLVFTTALLTTPVSAAIDPGTLPTGYQAEVGNSSYSVDGNTGTLESNGGATIGSHEFFNIGSAAQFIANIDVAHLNRVRSGSPSEIFGKMQINGGKFFLVNTGGIFFAPGSQVNASGLVASTLDINNQDFLNGKYKFTQNGAPGSIVNDGGMYIGKGGLALLGGSVENRGLIQANESTVVLGSGKEMTLSFDDSGLISVVVDKEVSEKVLDADGNAKKEGVSNSGIVRADGGRVVMTAEAVNNIFDKLVNNRGLIEANSIGSKTGDVELSSFKSSGIVANSGTINAKGVNAGEKGGKVVVEGEKVALLENSVIDASGDQGGGKVSIGGGFHGIDAAIRNAQVTYVDPTASVKADALSKGDGGQIAVWSDGITGYYGNISAKGGSDSGDGGFVEVSGKEYLDFQGNVDVSASNGLMGSLLIDPSTLTILDNATTSSGSPFQLNSNLSDDRITYAESAANNTISWGKLKSLGDTANIILQSTGLITFGDITGAAGGSITAANLAMLDLTTGSLTVRSNGGNIVFTDTNDVIRTSGGAINFSTTGGSLTLGGFNTANAGGNGAVTLSASNNVSVKAISAGSGAVTINADTSNSGAKTLTADSITGGAVILSGGTDFDETINLNGNVTGTSVDIKNAQIVNLAGSTNLTSTAGDLNVNSGISTIKLNGANGTSNVLSSTGGSANFGVLSAVNNSNLTVNSTGDITVGNTSVNNGALAFHLDTDNNSSNTLTAGALTAGGLVIDGTGKNDTATLNDAVFTGNNPGSISVTNLDKLNVNVGMTAGTSMTLNNINMVNMAGNAYLNSGFVGAGDLDAQTNVGSINLSGANGTTNTITTSNEGAVKLAAITANNNPGLTVNSQAGVNISSANVGTGALSINVDTNNNGINTLTAGALTGGAVSLSGGTNNLTVMDLNGDVTGTSLTIQKASMVNLADNVDLKTTNGDLNAYLNVGGIKLKGADGTSNVIESKGGSTTLGILSPFTNITAVNNANLTVSSTNDVTLGSVNINNGALNLNVDTDNNGSSVMSAGALQAGSLTATGTGNNDTITFRNNVTTAGNQAITAGTIQTNGTHQTTTAGSSITLTGNTTLQNNTQLTTNNGNITATGTIDGDKTFGVTAGTGNVDLQGNVGTGTALTSLTVSGASTARFGGNVTTNDDQIVTASAIQTNAIHAVNNAGKVINLTGDVELQNNTTLQTNDGDITVDGKIDGAHDLTLDVQNATAGKIWLKNQLGSVIRLGLLQIKNTTDFIADDDIFADSIKQDAGTGTTTVHGNLNTNGVNGIDLVGNNFTIGDDSSDTVTTTNGGDFCVTNAGTYALKSTLNLSGKFCQLGSGPVELYNNVVTSGFDITFAGDITLKTDNLELNAGTGTLNFLAGSSMTDAANSYDLTLTADEINLPGATDANSWTVNGDLLIQPLTPGMTINVAGATETAGSLDLTENDLNVLADGFNLITIGRANGSGTLNYLNSSGTFVFKDAITFQTPLSGGEVHIDGNLVTGGSVGALSDVTILGSHDTTYLNANIITAGADVLINDKAIVQAANVLIDTTNGGAVVGGANVQITDNVDGQTVAGQNLTVNAGTAGNVTFDDAIGATTRLGALEVTRANNLTASDIAAKSIATGATGITGIATFNGKLDTTGAAGIDLNGNVFKFNDSIAAANTGGFTLTNTGDADFLGAANVDGAFLQDGAGTVNVSNNITTNANDITFAGPVVLKQNVQFSTGAGIGDIEFQSTVDADSDSVQNLTLLAGAGDIKFDDLVGDNARLNALVITSANNVTAAPGADIKAVSVAQTAGTGTTTFEGLDTTGALGIDLNGNNFTLNGPVNTAGNGTLQVTNAGTFILNDTATLDGALIQDGAGLTVLNGDITTTNDLVSFISPVILAKANEVINVGNANINFGGTINGAADGVNGLELTAGTGNIVFADSIGQAVGSRLGDILIHSVDSVTASGSIKAASIAQLAGTDTTTFDGVLNTNGNGIDLKGNNFNINQQVITSGGATGNVKIDNSGLLLIGANGDMILDGSFKQVGAGDVRTAGDITTAGGEISFHGPVTLVNNITLNTTNGVAAGKDITFDDQVLALAAGVQGLNLNAGTGGNILFSDIVGNSAQRLGNLTITNAKDATFSDVVTAGSVTQIAGTGTTTFDGKVNTNNATGIDLTGSGFTFNDDVSTDNNGGVNVTNSGVFKINNGKTLTLDGAFLQDGTGANQLNGNILTTGDSIIYTSATTLTGDASLNTTNNGFPAGAEVTFVGTLDGSHDLTVQSGLAQTLFNDNVGAGSRIGDGAGASVILNSAGTTTFNKDLNTKSGVTAAGPVVFNGNVSLGDGTNSGNTASTFNNNVTFHTGLGGKTFSAEDGATFGQLAQNHHVTLTGSSLSMSTTDSNLLFNSDVNGATNLTLDSGSGNTKFVEAVGNSTALGTGTGAAITINTATGGITTFDKTIQANSGIASVNGSDVVFKGNVTLNNGDTGSALLGNTTFNGLSSYTGFDGFTFGTNGANTVTLTSGPVSLVSNNGAMIFEAAVKGPAALSATAGTGDINFKSTVGAASNLASLTVVSSDETRFGANVTTTGGQTVNAATIKTNAINESTAGNIQLNGNLELENNTTLKTDASAGGNVTVTGKTDSAANTSLTVLTNAATVDLQGNVGTTNAPSTLSVTNTGGTTRFGGNVTTTGAQDVTSGTIQTNGKFETTDSTTGTIDFTGNVELQNDTTFKTNDSNVTITGNVVDALENLTFNTGSAGDVLVTGNIGTGVARIGQLLIQNMHNFTLTGDIFATSIQQITSGAGGLTWFQGNMDTNGASGISLKGNDITIGSTAHTQTVTTTNGGGFTVEHDLNPTGVLTIYSDMNLGGTFKDLGFGPTNLFGNITTSGASSDIIFAGDLLLGSAATNLVSGGNIEFDGFVDGKTAGANDLNLTAGKKITFKKNVGGGNTAVSAVRLGDLEIINAKDVEFNQVPAASGAALTATSLKQDNGSGTTTFNGITGGIDVDTAGVDLNGTNFVFNTAPVAVTGGGFKVKGTDITLTDSPVTVSGGGGITLTNSGVLTINNNSDFDITGGGNFLQDGNGTAFTGSDITTHGGNITWNDPTLTDDVTMDSGGGNISFFDHIDSDATPRDLTLIAGAGNIVVGTLVTPANIGAVSALNDIDIVSANDVTINGTVTANSLTQEAGSGTTTLNGALLTTGDNSSVAGGSGNGDGVELNGTNFNLNSTITTQNGGNVEINNSGTLNIASTADMNLDGSFTQFGGGAVNTAGDITTTNDDIFFTDAVTLTGSVAMSTGAGAGNITFANTLDATTAGVEDLTLSAGTGNIFFGSAGEAVGGVTRLGDIVITSANDVTATGNISASSLTQNAGTGLSRFIGNVDTNTAQGVDLTGNNFQFDGNVLATAGKINVNGSGTVIVGDALKDTMIADRSITLRGDTTTLNSTLESDADLSGAEAISITADRAASSDVLAYNTITSHGGNITIAANHDVLFDAVADVSSNNGNVSVTADADADQKGRLTMQYVSAGLPTDDRAEIRSGSGKIALSAGEDVTLGGLTTSNTAADAVKVTSTNGVILDGGESINNVPLFDIDARNGGVQLAAGHGIGTGSNGAVEIWTSKLSATSVDGDIIADLNDPLVQGIDDVVGSGPIEVTNASVTGGAGNIAIRQLADSPMTVDNASTANGAINFNSIADLIVANQITAGGADGAVNLTADAPPGKNGKGNLIINPNAVVTSSGNVNMSGVNAIVLGQVSANNSATILADTDVFLGLVKADTFYIGAGRNILDTNADNTNLVGNHNSTLAAGGIIGTFNDPIEFNISAGDLIATAGSSSNGVSINLHGSLPGDVKTNLTDGLVLFNAHAVAGQPLTQFNTDLYQILNLVGQDGFTNGMEDLQHAGNLRRGLGLKPGIETPYVPVIEAGRFNAAPNVVVNEKESRLWQRKVRPVVTPVVPVPQPVVAPAPVVVIPTPIQVQKPAPVLSPIIPVQAPKPAPILVKPNAAVPQSAAAPAWTQQAQDQLRTTNLQGQLAPVMQPGFGGNRLFQQNVEEAPRADSKTAGQDKASN